MLALALALAVAAPDLRAIDDANLMLTSCLFGVLRREGALHSNPGRVAAALASGCSAERARYRSLAIAIDVERGQSRAAATADVDDLLSRGAAHMLSEYERFAAMGLYKPAP